MKTLRTLLVVSVFIASSISVQAKVTDEVISSFLVGTWEHVSSTRSNGDVTTYHREFQLFEDGSGICINYTEKDTLTASFQWEVRDSTIHLYVLDRKGRKFEADIQYVSLVDQSKMYLAAVVEERVTRNLCYYRRKVAAEEAKF